MIAILVGISILGSAAASKILLLHPLFSKSHESFHSAIAKHLLAAGHHVTAFTSMPGTMVHPNYTEVDTLRPDLPHLKGNVTNFVPLTYALKMRNSFSFLLDILDSSEADCYHTIQLQEMQHILKLKEKSFDVLILDLVLHTYECFLPIADKLNIPVIGTVATRSWRNTESIMGNPYNPAYVPLDLSLYSHEMTFMQRLWNTIEYMQDTLFYDYIIYPKVEQFYQKHFPSSTVASRRKPSLLFLNSHPVLTPRPLVPNIIAVGGIHVQRVKPLPNNLKLFIEGAEKGVILFSLGSMIQSYTMPVGILSIFREVFAQLPQRIIWKSEEKIEGLSENILLSDWLPQRDVLAHKNVIAFVTHGGIAGIFEALHSGTPMILTPLFFDQMSNAALIQQLGLGVSAELETLTTHKLLRAFNEVINNTKYASQAKVVSKIVTDPASSPQENIVFWTEYVIRHKGAECLKSVTSSVPMYEYLSLDVIGFIILSCIIVVLTLYYLWRNLYYLIVILLNRSEKFEKNIR